MRKLVSLLTVGVLLLSAWPAGACGDKLLVLGRGVRFQVSSAEFPASILLYMNPDNPGTAAMSDIQLQSIMTQAGHKLHSVKNREEMAAALKTRRYDLVLADFADAPQLETMVQSALSQPLLLPWIYQATKAQKAKAESRYQLVLKAPASVGQFLSVVDRTMEIKSKLARLRTTANPKVSLLR